jgi:lipid II:glycine glycyltransferase (peptidoglycan interpeptide bridge formation enzyme)
MKEKIKKILETKFNIENMTIEQLSTFYNLYEKVNKTGGVK